MWKAFLLLACVAGYMAIVSCDDEPNPSEDTEPIEETETDGPSSDGSRRCRCSPPICPKNEVYYNCSGGCIPRRCSEIGFPVNCDKKCTPGCVCKDGYVRAKNGTCIPIPECPSCGGDANAQQGCSNYCGHSCSDYNKPPRPCPRFCIFNGCACRKGYVYDYNIKACVKPKDCTPICKVNEQYSSCVNGGCDARNCSQIGKPVPCKKIDPKYCIKGCICVKGYLRAKNGTCVPKDQCKTYPPICPKNEVYYNCSGGCVPRRCSELGFPLKCDKKCTPGCVCKDGYVRADDGTCIPIPKCPSCGGDEHAQQGCGINCGRTCSTYKNPPKPCPPGCIFNGCDCRKGYVYDNIKKACVKPKDCTPICKVNEQYSSCVNGGCDARNCSQIGKPVPCKKIDPKYCIKGCICVKGYLRAKNGTCIPKDQCKTYPPICPKNEVYYNCSGGCVPRRCSELGFPLKCDKKCTPGCVCKDGYVRADDGTCIPIPKCPSCGGDKNAQQGCGINCGRTCSTYKNPPKQCPLGCIFNGCDCRKGYVYDNIKKKCVKPEDCTPICGLNEVYSSCTNGGCGHRNCSQLGQPELCIDVLPEYCTKGCVCADGYLRADNGTCVPKDKCPNTGCGGDPNAQPGCGYNCGRTCSSYKIKHPICPRIACRPNRCDCKDGYVYDSNIKKCVLPKECTPICKVNEQYSSCVNGGCDARNCSQIGKPVPCKKIDPKYCIKGCICVKGYLRAKNGTCVPKDQCKTYPPICPKNEVYYNCSGGCVPRRCSELGFPLKCDKKCTPGCVCKDGYVRADDGTCIPIPKCPSCGGDKNAQQGCGINCGRTCSTYKIKHPICPRIACKLNGCDCKDGYVYDSNIKKCVLPKKCTPICKVNEEYNSCVNCVCEPRNCSQIGKKMPCIHPKHCIKGCICIKGYLRASNGTCVPKDQCTPKCDKPNEVYDVCPIPCPPKRCDVNEALIKCGTPPKPGDPDCKPGCRCADKYYRNATGTCVLKKHCEKPLICDRPNEVYDGCGIFCPPQECGIDPAVVLCLRPPEYGDPACKPRCVCIDGYVRNDARECVPRDKCPKKCGKNEHWEECYYSCGGNQTCDDIGKKYHCPVKPKCYSGCRCDKGYWRNADNVCIPENQCPKKCGKNEHWEECYYSCGGNQTCGDIGKKYRCPAKQKCYRGCRCDKGYWRNADNVCIPENQCPKCDKPHQVYDVCPDPCPRKRCDVKEELIKCKAPPKPGDPDCKPGCRCANNYYLNATGSCVLKKNCEKPLPCDKPNEVYNPCPATCPSQECGVNRALIRCQRPPEYGDPDCKPSCVCIEGYFRNDARECVPWDKCTQRCPDHEVYSTCTNGGCDARNCSQIGKPVPCVKLDPKSCIKGCVCVKGYLRASDGTCVPKDRCTSRCYGKNEVWVNCYQGCSNQSCDDIGKIFHCPNQPAGQCKSGCRCEPGTWRNASNVCVPQEECPKPKCPSGEDWNWCPTIKCDGDYCPKTKDSPQTCPVGIVCDKPRCVCKSNRKRDFKTGKCIRIQDCPKFKCGCNEEYQACPPPCPGEKCSDYIHGPGRCPLIRYICRPQCRCVKGYCRDANGTCIPACDCPGDTSVTTTEPPTTTGTSTRGGGGAGLTGILDGITAFTGISLYNRMKSAPSENIIMSAMSVFTPIAELCLWSKGSAYDQCIKLLNLKDKQDIRDTFPKLDASYGDQTTVNFSVAVKVYSDEKYKLSDGFKKEVVDVFNASAEELDFSKNKVAADIINTWVESKTNNRIQDLVTPHMFSSLTRLVLVNALYFKGTWLYEFNKNNTKEEDFYLNDGTTKKIQMMGQEIKDLEYGEIPSLDCTAVRVYYKGKTSSMIIILPNTKNGALDLAKNLQDPTNWKKVTDSLSPQKVHLYLPLFKITTTTDLKALLKEANITDWFNCENSGLEGLLAKHEDVCITEAIQKAFIEVNEQGAEAAAANAVVVTTRSLPLIRVFKANRAFLYYLEVGSVVPLCGAFNAFVGATTTAVGPAPRRPVIFRADHGFLYYILMKDTIIFEGHCWKPTD